MDTPVLVPLYQIDPNPFQQDGKRDELKIQEIAESLERNCENGSKGLLQVPSARCVGDRYQLMFGHHRFYAFDSLYDQGKEFFAEMPILVREADDQQMFEAMATENFKRRDIGDIERAKTIHDYMVKFNKNSVETASFFQMSPESVRDFVRLLKLPRDLQAGVENGTINRSNARRLLTIHRVAPDQVREVAKELTRNPNAEPDSVISNALRNSGTSVEMYTNSWRHDTEPTAGPNLWPLRLPAEKFPREHLPIIGTIQAAKMVNIHLETNQEKYVVQKKIDHFQAGGKVADMPGYETYASGKDADATIARYERLAHLINPPACSACPFYAKTNGSHFCAFKECYNRKSSAWRAHALAAAVQKLGIAQYDHKTDNTFIVLVSYHPEHTKLVKEKSPDLRLKKGSSYSGFDDAPDGFVIVAVGKTAEKLAEKEKNSSTNTTDSESYHAEQRRLAQMRDAHNAAMYDFLWNVGSPVFAPLLGEVVNLPFMKEFADRMVRGVPAEEPNGKSKKAERLDFYRRALLFSLLDDALDMWDICQKKKPVTALAKALQGIATTWGVKLPRDWMDQAAQADKAITVTAETAKE
jgi:ParB/RepB/Spo0J family partition protein